VVSAKFTKRLTLSKCVKLHAKFMSSIQTGTVVQSKIISNMH